MKHFLLFVILFIIPTWISYPETQTITIVPGVLQNLNFVLKPNGVITTTVDWIDDSETQEETCTIFYDANASLGPDLLTQDPCKYYSSYVSDCQPAIGCIRDNNCITSSDLFCSINPPCTIVTTFLNEISATERVNLENSIKQACNF